MSLNTPRKPELSHNPENKRLNDYLRSKEFLHQAFKVAQLPYDKRGLEYRKIAQKIIVQFLPHIKDNDGILVNWEIPNSLPKLQAYLSDMYDELSDLEKKVLKNDMEVLGLDLHQAFSILVNNMRGGVIKVLSEELESQKGQLEFELNHQELLQLENPIDDEAGLGNKKLTLARLQNIDPSKISFKGQKRGEGGMGEIYEHFPLNVGDKKLVIKFAKEELGVANEGAILHQEEWHEAVMKATQNSDNLMSYHGSITVKDELGFDKKGDVYENIDNMTTLAEAMNDVNHPIFKMKKSDPATFLEKYFLPMCKGVRDLHNIEVNGIKGVVHRDLKPDNFEVNHGKVFDLDNICQNGFQTRQGRAIGTPFYVSPEALLAQEITTRSDIYALGATLYDVFESPRSYDPDKIVMDTARGKVKIDDINPSFKLGVYKNRMIEIINQCMSLGPQNRMDIDELIVEIESVINGLRIELKDQQKA